MVSKWIIELHNDGVTRNYNSLFLCKFLRTFPVKSLSLQNILKSNDRGSCKKVNFSLIDGGYQTNFSLKQVWTFQSGKQTYEYSNVE